MCKLFISSGVLTVKQQNALILAANRRFKSSETDGFGFLAASLKHQAIGRYLNPDRFLGFGSTLPDWLKGQQNETGKMASANVLICHGRTSTNVKSLDYVHPLANDQRNLAHNGVVSFTGKPEDAPKSPCDTAQLLEWLVTGGTLETAKDCFSGYGALALYDERDSTLSVACDGVASLYVAKRTKGAGWVFATNADHLKAICHGAKIHLATGPLRVPKILLRFDSQGRLTDSDWAGFSSRTWTRSDDLSMGRELRARAKTRDMLWNKTPGDEYPLIP